MHYLKNIMFLPIYFILIVSCNTERGRNQVSESSAFTNEMPVIQKTNSDDQSTNSLTINVLENELYHSNIIVWEKTYGSLNNDEAYRIKQLSDDGFLVAGVCSGNTNSDNNGWVFRLSNNGYLLWETNYGGPGRDILLGIESWKSNGYLLCGNSYDTNDDKIKMWVLALDEDGLFQWELKLGSGLSNSGYRIMSLSNGNYVIVGYSYAGMNRMNDAYVVNMTPDGEILWEKTYGKGDSDEAFGVCEYQDNIFFAGYTGDNPLKKNRKIWIVSLDSFGNLIWQRQVSSGLTETAYDIEALESGFYLFGSCGTSGSSDGWAMMLNTNGNVVWEKRYEGGGSDVALSGTITQSGILGFTGFSYSFGKGWGDSWFVLLDDEGNPLGYSTFGGKGFDSFRSIQSLSSNRFIMAGKTASKGSGASDAWVMLIDLTPEEEILTNISITSNILTNMASTTITDSNTNILIVETITNTNIYSTNSELYIIPNFTNTNTTNKVWISEYTNHWEISIGKEKKDSIMDMVHSQHDYYLCGYLTMPSTQNKQGWIVEINTNGTKVNEWMFGDSYQDEFKAITTYNYSNLIAVGLTQKISNANMQGWIVEMDEQGNLIRLTNLGGTTNDDVFNDVVVTPEGEFIITGETRSKGKRNTDIWVLKLNALLQIEWENTYGGIGNDSGYQVLVSDDSNIIILGSYAIGSFVGSDIQTWIMKLDKDGNELWQKNFGAGGTDVGLNMIEIKGEGYLISGQTDSYRDVGNDVWLFKIDNDGNFLWEDTYITGKGRVISPIGNGLYMIGGNTGTYGKHDAWLFIIDSEGNQIWKNKFAYANNKNNNILKIAPINGDSYMIIGNTSDYSDIATDVWIFELTIQTE